ncbi:MAG: DUF5698 domain-containing protein [Tissierellia bacterium]|nr:DUF5698 domain-containing protein [Tissierellia bacterium]
MLNWKLLIAIFVIRVISSMIVSFRMIYSLQGRKLLSSFFGFFEATIFVVIVMQIMSDLENPVILGIYAGGYALGGVLAVMLEQKIGLGELVATVMLPSIDNEELIKEIRDSGLGVTVLQGEGKRGIRDVLVVSLHRKDLITFRRLITSREPKAFVSVASVYANGGTMKRLSMKG